MEDAYHTVGCAVEILISVWGQAVSRYVPQKARRSSWLVGSGRSSGSSINA